MEIFKCFFKNHASFNLSNKLDDYLQCLLQLNRYECAFFMLMIKWSHVKGKVVE